MVRISIKQKTLFTIFSVLILVVGSVLIYNLVPRPITSYDYFGIPIKFRMDLKEASKIPVYPDNKEIYNILWNTELKNLTIVFVNSTDNSLVLVEAFEITFKLALAYDQFNLPLNISAKEVESYNDLNATEQYPLIALIPPILADETSVRLEDNIIYIKGMTKKDFDLATVKFLMIVLGIV